ncbi:MAG: MFS transporter [Firmicutes bacterium]|nr:MFS transporter [Bacillota bacterium]
MIRWIMMHQRRNTIALFIRAACFAVMLVFVNVFLVAQVFVLSGESFTAVTMFFMISACANFVFFAIAVKLCKRFKAARIAQVAAGLACSFVLLVVLWSDGLQDFYLLFGALWGMATGMHFATGQFLTSRSFGREKVHSIMIWYFSIGAIVSVLFPFTFGLIIDLGSLVITAIIVLVIGIIQATATFFIVGKEDTNKRLRLVQYFRALRKEKFHRATWNLWIVVVLSGFVNVITLAVTVMVIMVFETNINLGALTSAFALGAILVLLGYKYLGRRVKVALLVLCMVVPLLGTVPLLFDISLVTVAIFQGVFVILSKIIITEEKATKISAVKYWGGEEFLLESNLFYAAGHWVGKMIAGSMLLLVGIFNAPPIAVATILLVLMVVYSLHALGLVLWKRKYSNLDKTG